MSITIVATVVPKVDNNDKENIFLYVYLTPRISYSGIGNLYNFRHIYNWPDYFCFFKNPPTFTIASKSPGSDPIRTRIDQNVTVIEDGYRGGVILCERQENLCAIGNTRIEKDLCEKNKYARKIWRGMFDYDTPVDGWEMDRTAFKLASLLTPDELNDAMNIAIQQAKMDLVTYSLKELDIPGIYDDPADESRMKKSLIDILNHLLLLPSNEKLISPYIHNTSVRIPFPAFLENLRKKLEEIKQQRDTQINDLSIKLSLREVAERNTTETREFHKKMAGFGNFPFLLKQTGWIWEYKIKRATIPDFPGKSELFIKVTFPEPAKPAEPIGNQLQNQGKEFNPGTKQPCICDNQNFDEKITDFYQNVEFLYPWTAISLEKGMNVDYRFKNAKDEFYYLDIDQGYIKEGNPAGKRYEFKSELIEKSQQFERVNKYLEQKYDFSFSGGSSTDEDERTRMGNRMNELPKEQQEEFSTLNSEREYLQHAFGDYTSSGISLHLKKIQQLTKNTLDNPVGKVEDGSIIDKSEAIVYGHNIHKGYRADVISGNGPNEIVKSLCQRWIKYLIKNDPAKIIEHDNQPDRIEEICIIDEDEGWVLESMQASKSDKLYVDEELFRWNDWSLCAQQLAKGSEPMGYNAEPDYGNIQMRIIPKPGSLPSLKFDAKYWFGLRFVDICGGGPRYDEKHGSHKLEQTKVEYSRMQGVTAPLIFLGHPLHRKGDRKWQYLPEHYGEDLLTLVIRSRFTGSGLQCEKESTTIRYIGPPKLDFHLAKKHGIFDDMMGIQSRLLGLSDDSKDLLEYTRLPGNIKGALDPVDTREEIIKAKNTLVNYLYDPLVSGYHFVVNGKKDKHFLPLYGSRTDPYFKYTYFLRFTLQDKPSSPFRNDYELEISDEDIQCRLQQGQEKEVSIQCGINQLISNQLPISKTKIRLVHAVEKPCLLYPDDPNENFLFTYPCDEIIPQNRNQGQSDVNISMYFNKFPCLTSEAFILHVLYIDKVAFVDKYYADGTRNTSGFILRQIIKVAKTNVIPDTTDMETAVYFSNLVHTFNDSKARCAFYRIEAISKFKKYFMPIKGNEDRFSVFGFKGSEPEYVINQDETEIHELTNRNYNNRADWQNILSSSPPPPPVVNRIVPLIKWTGSINSADGLQRICDTIRIYFKGDWYLSGENEKVVVFFANTTAVNGTVVNSSNVSRELENAISQLGIDPISETVDCKNDFILLDASLLKGYTKIINGLKIQNLDFENNKDTNYSNCALHAAVYEIKFMPPSETEVVGQYYIDIQVDSDKLRSNYYPIFKFALARYQPDTIATDPANININFSKPVVTDFVPLLPYRKLTKLENNNTIKFHAPAYRKNDPANVICTSKTTADAGLFDLNGYDEQAHVEKVLSNTDTDLPVSENAIGSLIIEEYERYEIAPSVNISNTNKSHNDLRKRLVFSYIYTPQK